MKTKKSKAIIKREESGKKLVWAGAQALMTKPVSQKEQQERNLVLFTAKALEINPFGVNILGNLPYTNNIGRKEKMAQYDKNTRFEYDRVKVSENDDDKAVCLARIVTIRKNKEIYLTGWVAGECSPATTKMKTLRGYQNHIAQTRAENRAFEAAFGNQMRKELFTNIQKNLARGEATPEVAKRALVAGGPSAEEIMTTETKDTPVLLIKTEKSDPVFIARDFILNTRTFLSLESAEKRIKESKDFNEGNKKYLLGLVARRKQQIR